MGAGVSAWNKGQRVGVGWHGGQDNTCRECRRGDFRNCRNLKIPGISYDGGYQQYMVAPIEALVPIPETLTDTEAAPLLCAGITTYNALRHSRSFRLQGACLGMWSYSKRAGCACVASGSRKLLKPMPTSRKRCSVLSSTRSRSASAMVVNSAQEEGGELGV